MLLAALVLTPDTAGPQRGQLLEAGSLCFPPPPFCTFNFIFVAVLFSPSLHFPEGVVQVSLIYYGLFVLFFFSFFIYFSIRR